MDDRYGRFQILQRQLELVWIALFRSTLEGHLLERGDQLFQVGDLLTLALIWSVSAMLLTWGSNS